jgi:NADH-quinone oxidoreductase subunit M
MEFLDSHILFMIVILPLLGAMTLIVVPSVRVKLIKQIVLGLSSIVMLCCLYVFAFYFAESDGFRFYSSWNWLELPGPWVMGELGISLSFGVDGMAVMMILLTGIVMFTGAIISCNISTWNKDFFILYLLLLSGVFGVFATLDLFFFFFFYELSVVPMYLLIGVWGSSSKFKTFSRTKEYGATSN